MYGPILTSTLAQIHDKDHLLRFYSANALPLIMIGYQGDSHWRDFTLKYCVIVTLQGVDLAADQGTPILASDRGTITFAGWSGGLVDEIFGHAVLNAEYHFMSQSSKLQV
jgi:murein DD-endopeptidase MepM/ murein hydrolase activator NlpD